MALPGGNLTVWTDVTNPSIVFYQLPEEMPLMAGWPDAVGADISGTIQFAVLGDIQLESAIRGAQRYKIEFSQHEANAYVIFNGAS